MGVPALLGGLAWIDGSVPATTLFFGLAGVVLSLTLAQAASAVGLVLRCIPPSGGMP